MWSNLFTMLVKRNATLNYEFFVAPLNEGAQLRTQFNILKAISKLLAIIISQPPSKLIYLFQGVHKKFMDQSCVSFDQHCTVGGIKESIGGLPKLKIGPSEPD